MSDFGFVNRRGDNNRSSKRPGLNALIGPMPNNPGQGGGGRGGGQAGGQGGGSGGYAGGGGGQGGGYTGGGQGGPSAGRGRGNGVPPPVQRGAPRPPPGNRQDFSSRPQSPSEGEDLYYRSRASQPPNSAAPSSSSSQQRERVTILKRQQSQEAAPTQLYPSEDSDSSDEHDFGEPQSRGGSIDVGKLQKRASVPSASTRTSAPAPAAPVSPAAAAIPIALQTDLRAAQKEISELKASIEALRVSTTGELKGTRDNGTQFFGLVDGGLNARALLFETPPKEMTAEKAVAKADKDAWVKLSHPQIRTERTLANGSTVVDMWLRAYAICPRTSDVSPFWVRERAEDDTPTFKKFAWYPTP